MVFYRLAANLFDAVRRVRQSESRQCPLTVKFYLGTLGLRPQVPSLSLTFHRDLFRNGYEGTAVIDDHPSLNTASTTSACQCVWVSVVGCRLP